MGMDIHNTTEEDLQLETHFNVSKGFNTPGGLSYPIAKRDRVTIPKGVFLEESKRDAYVGDQEICVLGANKTILLTLLPEEFDENCDKNLLLEMDVNGRLQHRWVDRVVRPPTGCLKKFVRNVMLCCVTPTAEGTLVSFTIPSAVLTEDVRNQAEQEATAARVHPMDVDSVPTKGDDSGGEGPTASEGGEDLPAAGSQDVPPSGA